MGVMLLDPFLSRVIFLIRQAMMFWIIEQSIRQLRCCPLFFTLFQYLNGFIQEWQSWHSTSKPFRYSNGRVCWTRSLGRRWFRNKQDVMRYWTKVSFQPPLRCPCSLHKQMESSNDNVWRSTEPFLTTEFAFLMLRPYLTVMISGQEWGHEILNKIYFPPLRHNF